MFLLAVAAAGCSVKRIHTQSVDRVDQEIAKGNRGYLLGTPPPAPERGSLKRKFIAIDINLEWPKFEMGEKKGKAVEKIQESAPAPVVGGPTVKMSEPEPVEEIVESKSEWTEQQLAEEPVVKIEEEIEAEKEEIK